MKTPFIKFSILLLLIALIYGCNENDTELAFGEEYVNSETDLTLIDSITVEFSTVKMDSILTSSAQKILVGNQDDEYFGELTYTSYFELQTPGPITISDNEVYDSAMLILNYASYRGDTMLPFIISIHQLAEEIELNDDDVLYNTSSVDYYSQEIGSKEFLPKPNRSDSIAIKISDEIGSYFFTALKDNNEDITINENFVEKFNGLAIVGDNANNAILGFQYENAVLRLFSHETHENKLRYFDFPINNYSPKFNKIEHDYSNTVFSKLENQKDEIRSEEADGLSFLQAGSGLLTLVRFPYLQELLLNDEGVIIKAELVFSPKMSSYDDVDLPVDLFLYSSDKYNNREGQLQSADGTAVSSDLVVDNLYQENTFYSFDITDYILDIFRNQYYDDENNGMIISFNNADLRDSFNRVLIDTEEFEPQLKLYILTY